MKNWAFLDGGRTGYVISDDGHVLHKGPAGKNEMKGNLEFRTNFEQRMTIHGALDRTDLRLVDALIALQVRKNDNGPYPYGSDEKAARAWEGLFR